MTPILAARPTKAYQQRRHTRERAIAAGIDPFVAGTTSTEDLEAILAAAPVLRIVPNADLAELDTPRLGVPLTPLQRLENSGMTDDEIASVLTFARNTHVESSWISADGYTPWDTFDGGDAA